MVELRSIHIYMNYLNKLFLRLFMEWFWPVHSLVMLQLWFLQFDQFWFNFLANNSISISIFISHTTDSESTSVWLVVQLYRLSWSWSSPTRLHHHSLLWPASLKIVENQLKNQSLNFLWFCWTIAILILILMTVTSLVFTLMRTWMFTQTVRTSTCCQTHC